MIRAIGNAVRSLLRLLLLWAVDGISLLVTSLILPGVTLTGTAEAPKVVVAFAAAFLLGLVNLLIRPLILLISRPLGFIGVFVIGFFANAITLVITAWLLPGFEISGLLAAIVGGLIFSAVNVVLTGIIELDDEGSFYQGVIERQAARRPFETASHPGRGLVMMEIDGLSYHHMLHAIESGKMPMLKKMMDEGGYVLSRVDCGIPSQTSACQAGIMFGDNHDIPAFRWYDKDKQKLYVSGSDAAELNARYANGNGLMRGGSSIDNMLNGDAAKSLLTLADLRVADDEQKKRRAEDIYLLTLNPYFLTRTIVLFLGEVIRELWQAWQQKRKNVYPRLNRLHGGYPFIRAATTVFVRDVSANLTILDIIRGAPSIYVTWPGYDEVAHHSGPWTSDAFGVLSKYDRVIGRVLRTIKEKAPRPYDLIVLSDHGQSFGPTFKMRYGVSIKEFIEQQLPQGTTVSQSMGGDTGVGSLTAVSGELENMQEQQMGGRTGRAVAKQGQRWLNRGARHANAPEEPQTQQAQVTAYGSGNLAQVYFDLYPRKILLSELNVAYPGMVDSLVQHEGIGIVCGYDDEGVPVVLGKNGRRNLHTGEVTGQDPLAIYAPSAPNAHGAATIETRVWQVRRVMDFPHAGDLMVISTVFDDGTVAALEELIGNHGGLGGEQTDAFLFHPRDMVVPPTRNSIDVFHILNARRDTPVDSTPVEPVAETPDQWSFASLWQGIKLVRVWGARAIRSMAPDRATYRDVADDTRMNAPALVIGLVTSAIVALYRTELGIGVALLFQPIAWLLSVAVVYWAGRLLARQGTYSRTLRALGFARSIYLLELLTLLPIPGLAGIINVLVLLVGFVAIWLAAATAHGLRGWRTLILPLLAILVAIVLPVLAVLLLSGAALSVQALLANLGFVAQ